MRPFSTFAVIGLLLALLFPSASTEAQSAPPRRLTEDGILVAIHNQAPWGYVDKAGAVVGFYPDLIRAVFGPELMKKIHFKVVDWPALIPSLVAHRVDMVASGMAITPQRCKQVAFSSPDVAIGDGVLVRAGNPLRIHSYADMAANQAIRMGGGRGSTNTENAVKAGVPKDRMQLFDVETGVAALKSGRIDALTVSTATAIAVLAGSNEKGIERALPFTGYIESGRPALSYAAVAFRLEDHDLLEFYETALRKRQLDGTVAKISSRYGFSPAEMAPSSLTADAVCSGNAEEKQE
ncbi:MULTISPECIES: transporter substrate-binding domain-containing protein [Paraburkholderia]|uniref:Transporter substrate-binding domain-containing protein n=1 Tax=Paraburkholderia dipogonis TaxID=1211383 RepID=A0A4Y8MGN8_9BURK|nr:MULTISPECIES: transporter substrate-binding domain-containing protein [Paraburkholderia]RKR31507.1 amino acid ABC transporter substrate-binding protein (PAAT family) [Paraburkholderia sp. BL17N1]TFE36565.1 transporter substrate-binding domain-containing protein [Paraburkholderia dipogonis]